MIIRRHRQFIKNYKKRILPHPNLDKKFEEKFNLFIADSKNPKLKDHKLFGSFKGLRAFSVTGNVRVVYRIVEDVIELYDIGSHNQVY
ncbi:MAG: Plasmid stabilization system [Candidatus Roizmanbacteria bacterium GW2011_GWA2_37_7]|uniref:Plasmid stabilization system n=1 Tax=Candidatus Roizmanbacteria bacterium GW2011_GWA2_37_7 TaxID=1618481 RepID=A0A0G0K9P3_9BACT|nr:MAG: Plasmid stabilization system [Candidatus Roizmanbacteria bacterium GW2011_GWA2_37_7]